MIPDHSLAAIPREWASPFSKRAFAWRQSYMDLPQHVCAFVLLLRSVPSQKSGVMVTRDIDTGEKGWLSVAVNEGLGGGVDKELVAGTETVLKTDEIEQLINLAQDLSQRYPSILDDDGNPAPADIEFGFINRKV